jgi:hypothetical protein
MRVWRYDHGAALELNRRQVTHSTSIDSSGQAFLGSARLIDRLSFCHVDSFQLVDEWDQETIPFHSNSEADVSEPSQAT